MTAAIREIASNTCLNSRSHVLNKFDMLKSDGQTALVEIFGPGYASMVLASVIYIWKCHPIEVDIDLTFPHDADDIPIKYLVGGNVTKGFADNRSYMLKNSTRIYPGK